MIVGGVIGLLGGLLGPPLTHFLIRRARARDKRLERMEDLLTVLHEYEHCIAMVRDSRVFGAADPGKGSPLPKGQAIVSLFFPQFEGEIRELERLGGEYELWMHQKAVDRLNGQTKGVGDGESHAHNPYYAKLIDLRLTLARYGKEKLV